MMTPTRSQLLKNFDKCCVGLVSLLQARQCLTVNQQLFIENRLMMLQMEYRLWAGRLQKTARLPAKNNLAKNA